MKVAKFNLDYALLGHPLITSENLSLNDGVWYRPEEYYNILCKIPEKGYACFHLGKATKPDVRTTDKNLFLDIREEWKHPNNLPVEYEIIEDNGLGVKDEMELFRKQIEDFQKDFPDLQIISF